MAKTETWLLPIIDRLGRPRTALILTALEMAVLGSVNLLDFPLSVPFVHRLTGHTYLDMCGFCSADTVLGELYGLGERGRMLQALLLATVDVLIPTLSCLCGLSALAAVTRPARSRGAAVGWLLAVPVLALVLDFGENGVIAALLFRHPADSVLLAGLEGLLSGLKFIAYGTVVLSVFAVSLGRLLKKPRSVEVG